MKTKLWIMMLLVVVLAMLAQPALPNAKTVDAWHARVGDPEVECDRSYTIPVDTTWVDDNGASHVGYIDTKVSWGLTGTLPVGTTSMTVSYYVMVRWFNTTDYYEESGTRIVTARTDCYEECSVWAEPEYGLWSLWEDDPQNPGYQIRWRHVVYKDSRDSSVICHEEDVSESRLKPYEQCSVWAAPEYGEPTPWADDPDRPGWEVSWVHVIYRDSEDSSVVCHEEDIPSYREKSYEQCSVWSDPIYDPDWSDWLPDPLDPTRLYRWRHVIYKDSADSSVICHEEDEFEYKDAPKKKKVAPYVLPPAPPCPTCPSARIDERPQEGQVTVSTTSTSLCVPTWNDEIKGWDLCLDLLVDYMGTAPFSLPWKGQMISATEVTNKMGTFWYIYDGPPSTQTFPIYGLHVGKYDESKWSTGEYKRMTDVVGTKNVLYYSSCAISYFEGDVHEGRIWWKAGSNTWELSYFLQNFMGYTPEEADKIALIAHEEGSAPVHLNQ